MADAQTRDVIDRACISRAALNSGAVVVMPPAAKSKQHGITPLLIGDFIPLHHSESIFAATNSPEVIELYAAELSTFFQSGFVVGDETQSVISQINKFSASKLRNSAEIAKILLDPIEEEVLSDFGHRTIDLSGDENNKLEMSWDDVTNYDVRASFQSLSKMLPGFIYAWKSKSNASYFYLDILGRTRHLKEHLRSSKALYHLGYIEYIFSSYEPVSANLPVLRTDTKIATPIYEQILSDHHFHAASQEFGVLGLAYRTGVQMERFSKATASFLRESRIGRTLYRAGRGTFATLSRGFLENREHVDEIAHALRPDEFAPALIDIRPPAARSLIRFINSRQPVPETDGIRWVRTNKLGATLASLPDTSNLDQLKGFLASME